MRILQIPLKPAQLLLSSIFPCYTSRFHRGRPCPAAFARHPSCVGLPAACPGAGAASFFELARQVASAFQTRSRLGRSVGQRKDPERRHLHPHHRGTARTPPVLAAGLLAGWLAHVDRPRHQRRPRHRRSARTRPRYRRPTRHRCQDYLGCLRHRNRYRHHTPVGKYPFGYQRVKH